MRILIVHQYFFPDISAASQLLADLATALVERRHQVSVIASRAVQHGCRGKAPAFERVRGVTIHRTWASNLGKRTIVARVTDYASFLISAALRSLTMGSHDVVVLATHPPLLPALGPTLRRVLGAKFVYLSEDVYPELLVKLGILRRDSAGTRLMGSVIRWSQRRADRVVVVGRCMRDVVVAEGLPLSRVQYIPNWACPDEVFPLPEGENPMAREVGIEGSFGLVYSGNMGWGHDFSTFLGAAAALQEDDDVRFLFIGEGYRRAEVVAEIRARGLDNVTILPYQPREQLSQSLSLGEAALISQRSVVDGLLVPCKLYAALAAAKPVLFVGSETCEVGRTILEAGCGLVVAEGDVQGLVQAIERLRADQSLRRRMGSRGRAAFEQRFQRRHAVDAYEELFRELVGMTAPTSHRPSRPPRQLSR